MTGFAQRFSDDLVKELTELKRLGIKVSNKAIEKAKDIVYISENYDESADVSDIADIYVMLY